MTTKSSTLPPLGKFLASSEKSVRDKAVAALSSYLSARKSKSKSIPTAKGEEEEEEEEEEELEVGELNWNTEFKMDSRLSEFELSKLWQGIFYCFWMSDKPLVQQALANHLASLLLDVRPKISKKNPSRNGRVGRVKCALAFLKGFWETVTREWAGLDRLRLDKFYLLLRRFIGASFKLLAREEWDLDAIAAYNHVLTGPGGPLSVLDTKIPHSIAYHLSDIYVEELERSLPLLNSPLTPTRCVPLAALLTPFITTLALAPSKTLFERVVDNVFKPLTDELLVVGLQNDDVEHDDEERKSKKQKKVRSIAVEDLEYPRIAAYGYIVTPVVMIKEGEEIELQEEEEEEEVVIGRSEVSNLIHHLLRTLFKEGGKTTTGDVNRRRIYTLYRGFMRE